jgi:hypothetical protein
MDLPVYLHLVFVQTVRVTQEKIRDLSKGADALRRRANRYDVMK